MVTIGVVAGVIVALGTIIGGVKVAITSIYKRGREDERKAAELEELKKLLSGE